MALKILFVDDSPTSRLLIHKLLEPLEADIDVACDGMEGLARFQIKPYDLCLMDIQMPKMDGYQAVELIRKTEQVASHDPTPVVALTAHSDDAALERIQTVGFTRYLQKPYKQQQLLDLISELLK